MEPEAWIAEARKHQTVLADLIRNYHPRSVVGKRQPFLGGKRLDSKINQSQPLPITAPNAEAACELIRTKIRTEDADLPDPVHIFNTAVDGGDHSAAYSIVSETWFGVPESTACWSIPGFAEACNLLGDPPETDTDEPTLLDEITERDLAFERGYEGDL